MKSTFEPIPSRLFFASLVLTRSVASVPRADDGAFDQSNEHPADGAVFFLTTISGQLDFAGGDCSGSLIAPDIFLTAAHCIFYDSRKTVEIPGYQTAYRISFDNVATENDLRGYLKGINHPGADALACDPASTTGATFHKGAIGVSHPDCARITEQGNGTLNIKQFFADHQDLGVIILEAPGMDIAPLATQPLGTFDDGNGFKGAPLTRVGCGLNLQKSTPAAPMQPGGAGPSSFGGFPGLRRTADVGTLRTVTNSQVVPTEQSSLDEDTVCVGDSGGPLFLGAADGTVDRTISGVLTGGSPWRIGAHDAFARVDSREAVDFLACVESASTLTDACPCGIEDQLDLCD